MRMMEGGRGWWEQDHALAQRGHGRAQILTGLDKLVTEGTLGTPLSDSKIQSPAGGGSLSAVASC